jgi:hypothetical protein
MHRTQISLEREHYEWLMREARSRGVSLAAVVRELIVERLGSRAARAGSKTNRLGRITGIAAGDGAPVGRNHNEFLYGRKRT